MFYKFILFILISFLSKNSFAQHLTFPIYFNINAMENLHQIDSLKKIYNDEGFMLVKEASVLMYNNYETTVFLPLREGNLYKFIFIGDLTSKYYQLKLYDFEQKKSVIINQKIKDEEKNILQFYFVPKFTEFYTLKSLQINKLTKTPSAFFLLFRKVN